MIFDKKKTINIKVFCLFAVDVTIQTPIILAGHCADRREWSDTRLLEPQVSQKDLCLRCYWQLIKLLGEGEGGGVFFSD